MESKFDAVVPHIESRVSFKSPLKANTVEIHIKREKEEYYEYQLSGRASKIGSSSKATPFPTPVVLLNDVVSFEPDYIRGLLYSITSLQDDDNLCNVLCHQIVEEAEGARGGPLYIFVGVRLIPHIFFYGGEEKDKEICAICMEDITYSNSGPHSSTMSCDHEFHDECLYNLFIESSTPACPLCGTIFDDDKR